MEKFQHQFGQNDRRVMSRIDAALRINYQVISEQVALNDPYDSNFVLPRYFLLLAELDQFDLALDHEIEQISEKDQQIARILSLFNQKLNLITGTLCDAIVQSLLPVPSNVNISESGLSFLSDHLITENTYIHITLSHPENFFHIAAIAQVIHCREEDNGKYRTGAYFITLLPQDRSKLSEAIKLMQAQQS